MASIGKDPNGRTRILFLAPDGKRKTIRLGKATMKQADAFRAKIEALIGKSITGVVDDEVSRWLAGLDAEMYGRLVAVGLVTPRAATTTRLGEFLDAYIAGRPDIKPRTKWNLEICARRLVEHFGKDRLLRDIKPGDADDWCSLLRAKYANATAARNIKRAKQFFAAAIRKELISRNPFADCKADHQSNPTRFYFVKQEDIELVIRACPDAEWRLIVALCRYGGLRCPTELLALTWPDVDWERNRFCVHAPKTEHHKDGGMRWVPIFPELRPYLEEAFHSAPEGSLYVINRYRDTNQNLRSQLARIVRRAGLTPWPKLFQNLRTSRQNELTERFPRHVVRAWVGEPPEHVGRARLGDTPEQVVCAWLGNTPAVADEHYLQVMEDHYEKAAQIPAQSAAERVCQQETAVPAEIPNVRSDKDLHVKSIPDKTYDYPQGDSNPCLSRERAMS
jgi:integrase